MEEEEEDYAVFGTPLPEIEDEATLRRKAGKELQVRDEKGRQRFHGAFTGGFSAGFFNTVGTKEGWAPSTFISSRSKVADRIQQNPEDFMDHEDFGEFGIATRKIHTTSNFQDTSVIPAQKRKYVDTDNVIPGEAPLKDIVQPVRESIGMLILKKLGWRPGQGIGPRIKKDSGTKIYGCAPLPDIAIVEENDPMSMAFTFAPEDTEGMSYHSKDNYFGLGYTGLSKQSVLGTIVDSFTPTTTKSWLAKDKRKLKISGQAFGVGAFEDEDEDIYGKDDMSQYDFSDLALKGLKNSNKAIDFQKPGSSQGILVGFCLASQPPLVKRRYPPPSLPPNFKPMHQKSVATSQNVNPTVSSSRHVLSATDRSLLLGEQKFTKFCLNASNIKKKSPNFEPAHNLPSSSATSANFQVFPNDIAKQQRYEEYLKLKEKGDLKNFVQPLSMTEWEKQQELEEFAKASILYKPLSSVLSSRFESRSHLSVEHEVMAALEKIKKEKEEKPIVTKKNLVGTSNRKMFEWHPLPLLCKRMNVPNPYPNSDCQGTKSMLKSKSVFQHLTLTAEEATTSKTEFPVPSSSTNIEKEADVMSKSASDNTQTEIPVGTMPVKSKENVVPLENQKPPMDFFKDIFANSSSEDEDEGDNEPQDNLIDSKKETHQKNDGSHERTEASSRNSVSLVTESIASNKSEINSSMIEKSTSKKVGFGVFANLDLDALNQRKPTKNTVSSITETKNDAGDVSILSKIKDAGQNQSETTDLYGPELPPNFSDISVTETHTTSPSKKNTKLKSSHKHKHHKHKHKKKKKKSSKRNSSSDSSCDELEDIPPSLIIEKLKKLQRRKS